MSGDDAGDEVAEVENDAIVLDAAVRMQCTECGTVVAARYELGEAEPDETLIPEVKAVCPTCTKNNGVQTVILCGLPAGAQYAAMDQAIAIAGELADDDDDGDEVEQEAADNNPDAVEPDEPTV